MSYALDRRDIREFPGSTTELPSETALCRCGNRSREWRLRGLAVDVVCTYLSGTAYREAVASRRAVIAKGAASGWAYETTPLDHGHPWQCALCHPPAAGLDVEWRDNEREDR